MKSAISEQILKYLNIYELFSIQKVIFVKYFYQFKYLNILKSNNLLDMQNGKEIYKTLGEFV